MQTRIHDLIIKELKGKLTPDERVELEDFKARSQANKEVVENLTDPQYLFELIRAYRKLDGDTAWQKLKGNPPVPVVSIWGYSVPVVLIRRYTVAAIIGVVVCLVLLFMPWKWPKQPGYTKTKTKTISNEFFKGELKKSKGVKYNTDETKKVMEIDTLQTSEKSYYSLQLPDGSIVWLNCASSLFFPPIFSGPERVVRLEGEAYFEVVKDPGERPFKVQVSGMEILVTGTKFNVKAYNDEGKVRTTLVEGSVKIKTINKTDSLKAGEQALLTPTGKLEKNGSDKFKKATLAWKENQFDWDKEHLETIIGDLCRWHRLKPDYRTNVSYGTYSATISRSRPLYQTLAILEAVTPYRFQEEGKVLIIRQR
jgi:hypothetical protein